MSEKGLKPLKQYYPELRYLFFHVKKKDRQNYIMHSDAKFVNMMVQICLNLVYCERNNLKLTGAQIKRLKAHKSALRSLLSAKTLLEKKQSLTSPIIHLLLSILIDVVSRMRLL